MDFMIPILYEWNFMFRELGSRAYNYRAIRPLDKNSDFVCYSPVYSKDLGEPVWFYGPGNARWLRCPVFTYDAIRVERWQDGWAWYVQFKRARAAKAVKNFKAVTLKGGDGLVHLPRMPDAQAWLKYWLHKQVRPELGVKCDNRVKIYTVTTGTTTCLSCLQEA